MENQLVAGIPSYAFINAQIIQDLYPVTGFQDHVRESVGLRYALKEWEFMNPAYVASLLYCLIVVSRHVFVSDKAEEAFWDQQVQASQMSAYFNINKAGPGDTKRSSQLLRRLRNSIAHVRYDIITDAHESPNWRNAKFIFRDRLPRANFDDFEASASSANVMKFLSEIGAKLANLRALSGPMQ